MRINMEQTYQQNIHLQELEKGWSMLESQYQQAWKKLEQARKVQGGERMVQKYFNEIDRIFRLKCMYLLNKY